ncbi:elongation factor P hydroxylase [Alteromonas sp. CYL-A6]|uniref:elongation factor P hydroxylase n=1 Tax=Alteromonas nitratireducens TaxID=3390813 RepID=UPI0034C3F1A6
MNAVVNGTAPDAQEFADTSTLIAAFNQKFAPAYNTRLVRGSDEPVYLPANADCPYHQIVFAHGFFSSALHEIAHWCIAGRERRLLEDYGYWYCPDGRDESQQRAFEQVEVKPQAIEKAFTLACQRTFRVSTDNLNGAEPDRESFSRAVDEQYRWYCENGFPPRAQEVLALLTDTFGQSPHHDTVTMEQHYA